MVTWSPIQHAADLPPLGTEESELLDFKADAWPATDEGAREIARDVAQFTNHLGGSLILGAKEDGANRVAEYVHVANAADVAQRVQDVCFAALSPRVEVTSTVVTLTAGLDIVVVNVPAFDGVVAIKLKGSERWEFYKRFGKGKRAISFSEVEAMWSEGRKGRLLMQKIPLDSAGRCRAFVDAVASDPTFLRRECIITPQPQSVVIRLSNNQEFGLPYEFIRAVWQGSEQQWYVSLTAHFNLDKSDNSIRIGYEP